MRAGAVPGGARAAAPARQLVPGPGCYRRARASPRPGARARQSGRRRLLQGRDSGRAGTRRLERQHSLRERAFLTRAVSPQVSNGVNVTVVQFFPLEVEGPVLPPAFGAVSLDPAGVLRGVVSDDACASKPCLHNATCEVTWNDYKYVSLGPPRMGITFTAN